MKVLFVCLGNICRSPMALFMFKDIIKKRKLERLITVDSCATSKYEIGNDIYEKARKKLVEKNISVEKHVAKQITESDFYEYDYIIGMDHSNIRDLIKISPTDTKEKIHLLLDISEHTKGMEVDDPWYTDDFSKTYEVLNTALNLWIEKILKTN